MTETSDTVSVTRGDLGILRDLAARDKSAWTPTEWDAWHRIARAYFLSAPPAPQGERVRDTVVQGVCADLRARSELGLKKYGIGLDANGNTHRQRLQHLYEELLDGANYIKGAIMQLDGVLDAATAPAAPEADIKELAKRIYAAWMKDERFDRVPAPQAFFWAELAAQAAARKAGEK
jgi:hypothetical protein